MFTAHSYCVSTQKVSRTKQAEPSEYRHSEAMLYRLRRDLRTTAGYLRVFDDEKRSEIKRMRLY
jgi:hypothetical protein